MSARANSHYSMTLLLAVLLGFAADRAVLAQQDAEVLRAIDQCSLIRDRDARLDCIDTVLAERGGAPPPDAEASTEAPPAPPAPPARAPASPPRAQPQPAAAPAPTERPSRSERRAAQRAEQAAQVRTVRVVAVSINALGHSTFVTEDGEAWVSVRTPERGYPDTPFAAEIEPGSIGSFFLRVPDSHRRLRVSLRE